MSLERILKIEPPESISDLVLSYFRGLSSIEELSFNEEVGKKELLYRFKEIPQREKWPEDLRVIISSDEIYLCFYSGNRKLREAIFNGLIGTLRDKKISFTEIED